MMYLKSRYFTFKAVIQSDGPMVVKKASAIKNGRKIISRPGGYLYHAISSSKITKLIKKSANDTANAAVGTINLGK